MDLFWLVPVAYMLHMMEETPRFIPWTKRYAWLFTARFTMPLFLLGNGLFMLYVLGSIMLSLWYPAAWTLTLGLSTAAWIFANFLLHAVLTLVSGEYSPGVVTAGSVYVPVSLLIYWSVWEAGLLTASRLVWSILIGFAVMYIPQLNAVRIAYQDRRRASTAGQQPG